MPFQLSPGVAVVEKDFTSIVPAVSTSIGGFAGTFQWGPIEAPTTVPSENELVRQFGKPVDGNADSFFTAANFLSYTNNLLVVRADTANAKNAVAQKSGSVSATTITQAGSGYTSVPTVTFAAPDISGGTQATGTATISGAGITAIPVADGGTGYTTATVTIAAPDQSGDNATATATIAAGVITGITIDVAGSGYTTAPTVTITGDGTGATAIAIVEDGKVKKIEMTNYGSGYRYANVTISTGGEGLGYAATARAVMTPFGGHGKDPINGTYARTLMFYTNISKDKNQGFDVNNDFRQLGLIKNPRKYTVSATDYATFREVLGSACFVLTGSINTSTFSADKNLRLNNQNTGKLFRIVSSTTTGVLVQSLENAIPTVGEVMIDSEGNQFTVGGVTNPTIDKYSGDILFIDNKQAFTPTEDQTVTLRTVLKF